MGSLSTRENPHSFDALRLALVVAALVALVLPTGCVRRRLNVRSNPPGAVVFVDNQQIGTTPCSFDFTYYGTREIRLVKGGYETLTVNQPIPTPWYQIPPVDFVSDNLLPNEILDHRTVAFNLEPQIIVPTEQLIERGNQLRQETMAGVSVAPPGAIVVPGPGGPPGAVVPGTVVPGTIAPGAAPALAPPDTFGPAPTLAPTPAPVMQPTPLPPVSGTPALQQPFTQQPLAPPPTTPLPATTIPQAQPTYGQQLPPTSLPPTTLAPATATPGATIPPTSTTPMPSPFGAPTLPSSPPAPGSQQGRPITSPPLR